MKKLFYLLLLLSLILFTQCDLDENYNNEHLNIEQKSIQINHITLSQLNSNHNKLNNLFKTIKQENENFKNPNFQLKSSDNTSFAIDTGKILQTTKDDIVNYTFKLIRSDSEDNYFENFIISQKNNEYDFYILKYQNDAIDGDVELVGSINIEENLLYTTYSLPTTIADVDVIDPCINIYYEPCDGVGNADGHDAVDGYCHGSATVFDFSNCDFGGGGSANTGGGSNTGNPPYTGTNPGSGTGRNDGAENNDNEDDENNDAGDNNSDNGSDEQDNENEEEEPVTVDPIDNPLELPDGAIALISDSRLVFSLENALGGIALTNQQEMWTVNFPDQAQQVLDFLNQNQNSQQAIDYILFVFEQIEKGAFFNDFTPPSCESFNFINETSTWQIAAVRNIHFRIVKLSPNNSYVHLDINYVQPILFGMPSNMVNGGNINNGLAAELSAHALYISIFETQNHFKDLTIFTNTDVDLYFKDRLRYNYPIITNGGRVNFNSTTSIPSTEYQTNWFSI